MRKIGGRAFGLVAAATIIGGACSSGSSPPASSSGPAPATTTTVATSRSAASSTTGNTTIPSAAAAASSEWTTYHADGARLGVAGPQPPLDPLKMAWQAPLDGSAVYGQPLVADGKILVATEDDGVFALDPRTGTVLWHTSIGSPLTDVASAGEAGCGDIDPLGVTSTPVADPTTDTLYVVGEVSDDGHQPVHHDLVAINIDTGAIRSVVDADPPLPSGENAVHLLQRAALLLANGRVYVGYGGQYGDCGAYHGWVVAVPEGNPAATTSFDVTPDSSGGAIWQGGGGPSVDASGNVYVSTGNPNSGGADPWAEAVVKLSANLATPPEASYQDRYATGDLDLATGDVVVLPDGDVFAVGKTDIGYLLDQSSLSEAGPPIGAVCSSDPDGGAAFDSTTQSIYVPCRAGGITQVDLVTHKVGWKNGEENGAPIIVNADLWTVSYPGGTLQELDPLTGAVLQTIAIGRRVPNFASPAAALGLLLIGTTAGVVALAGPSGPG